MTVEGLTRRSATRLLAAGGILLAAGRAKAAPEETIGAVEAAKGRAFARLTDVRPLAPAAAILLGDLVWTAADSRASLALAGDTRVHLGPRARLRIDRYVANAGGTLVLGDGAMIFDRPDDLPKIDLEVRTQFGLIAVRGTRFFAGPNRGVHAVFVERGAVTLSGIGEPIRIGPGEGVDLPAADDAPTAVKRWGAERIAEALGSVLGPP